MHHLLCCFFYSWQKSLKWDILSNCFDVFISWLSFGKIFDHLIINKWKVQMLACLCNNRRLFRYTQVTPNFAWHCFTACLLDDTFKNKADHFVNYDRDRKIVFWFYLYDNLCPLYWIMSMFIEIKMFVNWIEFKNLLKKENRIVRNTFFLRFRRWERNVVKKA